MLLVVLALFACKKEVPEPKPADTTPPAICHEGTRWSEGQTLFAEATDAWGLTAIQATGVRLTAVDFDGDGYTDLAVRKGAGEDNFTTGTRDTWLLRNTGAKTFEDVTEASGIVSGRDGDATRGRPGVTWAWADVDNDGDLDVYTGLNDAENTLEEYSELRLNDGDGTFSLAPATAISLTKDEPYGASFTDVNRDGNIDLWITQYSAKQDHLYLGDGAGGFEDVTGTAGLTTKAWRSLSDLNNAEAHTYAWAALACDLNNDLYPELLSPSYGRSPNHLWRNNGDGTFENRSVASNYAYDHRTDWSDNESARCWCTLHPDDEDCEGVPAPRIVCEEDDDAFRWDHTYDREPFRLGGNSGETMCGDLNNDGWMDLVTTEIVHWDVGSSSDPSEALFNTQDPDIVFERPGNDVTGLVREHSESAWNDGDITGSLLDIDNDGWLDVYIGDSDYPGSRGRLWHQTSPEQFVAVPIDQGIDHWRSHGSAAVDFDRDGDLDLVVGHSSARCDEECYDTFTIRLFENLTDSAATNYLQLELVGSGGSNRAAVGARVEVKTSETTQTRYVDGGHGQWGNQEDLIQHVGLGGACEAEVTVTWPDAAGTVETYTLGGGYRYRVVQGEGWTVVE